MTRTRHKPPIIVPSEPLDYLRPDTQPSPVLLARALDLLGEPDAAPVLAGWWWRGEHGAEYDEAVDVPAAVQSLRRALRGAPREELTTGDQAVLDVLALLSHRDGQAIGEHRAYKRNAQVWRWAPMLLSLGVLSQSWRGETEFAIGLFDEQQERVVHWLLHGRCAERSPGSGGRCCSWHHDVHRIHEAPLPPEPDDDETLYHFWQTPDQIAAEQAEAEPPATVTRRAP